MLMKAKPIIDAVESIIEKLAAEGRDIVGKLVFLSPSEKVFNQQVAYEYAEKLTDIIFVCGRYEGIDYRFEQYMQEKYGNYFVKLSLGQFVTL